MTNGSGWRKGLVFLLWMTLSFSMFAQHKVSSLFCIHPIEKQLADSINQIRVAHGKKALPLSISLSYVARVHVTDLIDNHPDTSICNLSSWSNKGHWKPCCYNKYVTNHDCMWKKPKELTNYPYRGYEMAAYSQDKLSIDSILQMWEVSPEAMSMILTTGIWQKKSWACMGVGVNDHYVSVWFGQRPDREGKPMVCRSWSQHAGHKKEKQTFHHGYYLIYGSFPGTGPASKALKQLKTKGFKQAGILKGRRHIRVYIFRSPDFDQTKKMRQQLLKKYPELWILQN